jgi:hypothetical protein
MAGSELYYVLELETLTEKQKVDTSAEEVLVDAAPGYLMHAKSGKTFAFRCEASTSEAVLPADRPANHDESKDRRVNGNEEENDDEDEDESDEENEDESEDESEYESDE